MDVGSVGLNVTNVGTVGRPNVRNDPAGAPSFEYPIGSGIEHLFEGGLWIGARYQGNTVVSTASVDAAQGYTTGAAGFEYTPLSGIREISSLPTSPNFSAAAVSHQDLITNFTDSNVIVPGSQIIIQEHDLPLKAEVQLETYAWSFPFADHFVILNYTVTNRSQSQWDSVYFGLWTDLVVRNVNVTQDAGTAFFNKGGGGYLDSLWAVYVYQVTGDDLDYTRSYGANQVLGAQWRGMYFHPSNADTFQELGYTAPEVNAHFWNFREFTGGQFGAPSDDLERYVKMSTSLNFDDPAIEATLSTASNKTQLISLGPIPTIAPGETVEFTLALVAARQVPDPSSTDLDTRVARGELLEHLNWSRTTYLGEDLNSNGQLDPGEDLIENNELDRYILPEPPAIPEVKVVSGDQNVDIYWTGNSITSIDPISKRQDFEGFRLYRTRLGDDLDRNLLQDATLIAQWDSAGNEIGYNNGFEAITMPQPRPVSAPTDLVEDTNVYRFHYEVNGLVNGWQYLFILTAFDEGDEELGLEPLESSYTFNAFSVFPGTEPAAGVGEDFQPYVYPNPYRTSAAWDGGSTTNNKIYFRNLPAQSMVTIYTMAGDVVAQFNHNAATYRGQGSEWFSEFTGDREVVLAGGEHAWDLLTRAGQQITQGVYLFSVKDLQTENTYTGTFAILR